jgi:hypothetical protein
LKGLVGVIGMPLHGTRRRPPISQQNLIVCDLCGQAKECLQKEIDGREFDICVNCWQPFEEKLKGKGRVKRKRETVFLPPPVPQPEEQRTPPGLPPKIFGTACVETG